MALAEEQIKTAFEQSEKEVTDLHSRISQGMREAKKNGVKIGLPQGTTLITKILTTLMPFIWFYKISNIVLLITVCVSKQIYAIVSNATVI